NEEIWSRYCGFLDLTMDGYMDIQRRLLLEQMELWSKSEIGRRILKGKSPKTIDEFRQMVPITTYEDYADLLLSKRAEVLPDTPVVWIETTWEGGSHPVKVAPYTRSMLDVYSDNVIACLLLATSTEKGMFQVENTDRILYGLAPLPYATGLLPLVMKEQIDIDFLPSVKEAEQMSFSERNKAGFKRALKEDVQYFFGLGSVAYAISKVLCSSSNQSDFHLSDLVRYKPKMLARMLKAKSVCKREKREMKPKDLFKLKGFMVAGTDNKYYKDDLEDLWGIRPMEIFAGTEPAVVGTETWTRDGMVFFPDSCFYEFLPVKEKDEKTYLMDEVVVGEEYEIIVTVLKGGAFVRYRVGDIYRCLALENKEDQTQIPRFEYVDRISSIIDIAGFTRITEKGLKRVIDLSGLPIKDWTARKEYNDADKPYLHLYVEIDVQNAQLSVHHGDVLKEVLTAYFKYNDHDYKDLKKILGMDPLEITLLKKDTFELFQLMHKKKIERINPNEFDIKKLKSIHNNESEGFERAVM
ncbi:MAG TPA: auxin-responsive protein, partial [Eubacteriaceae bacterium]|nr:auxin-responsive protein [Eubacteriaceae bacterium]